MIVRVLGRLLLVLALLPTVAWGQGDDPLARALVAYRDLDYETAAARFRAALNATGTARLGEADRARALMHLGATELFRGRREPSTEAFRTLLLADPRYRPDEFVFPPEVSAAFSEVRLGVRAVAVTVPLDIEIRTVGDRFPIRIYASSLHDIRVTIVASDATRLVDVLYEGAVGDSLGVLWSARDSSGRSRDGGRYFLRVTSRSPAGRDEREVRIPIDVERSAGDTLPWPVIDSTRLRAESAVSRRSTRPLVAGLAAATAAALLPSIVGGPGEGNALRFGVAGGAGIAGIVGMVVSTRPRALPENVEFNRALRAAHAAEIERVRGENVTRRGSARLRLRSGRSVVTEVR